MTVPEWAGRMIEETRRKQKAIRSVSRLILEMAEKSGCSATDIVIDVALLAALKNDLSQQEAIDMVNRTQNRVVWFFQFSHWDNFVEDYRIGR